MTVAPHTESAIYVGRMRHRRFIPVAHAFSSRMFMLYLDLGELPTVLDAGWLCSGDRRALMWFRRADYLGDPAVPLDTAVRERVRLASGVRPEGPIRMLTHLRTFGYCFNPVTFYYCHDRGGALAAVVAEITNTPWKERRAYVLVPGAGERTRHVHRFRFDKDFHVSPFMPMDLRYDWTFSTPGPRIAVHMALERGQKLFDATLGLSRRPLTRANLARALLRFPFMTLRITTRIHFEALRLWLKRAPVHSHPVSAAGARP